jgi:hypothetical protein
MPTFRRRPRFALSLVALSASTVAAQAPLWSAAPLGTAADWGTRLDTLGDLDSDGVTDVLAVSGGDQRYEVRSGATGALLRSGGAVNSCPGIRAVALGDLNGDGLREVGIAVLPGLLSVVDARTGSQLRLEVPPALTQIRSMWVAVVGDVDADGIEDHIVSFSQDMRDAQGTFVNGGPGYSELRSGATGARLHIGPSNDFIFGLGGYCAGIGDVTGDGKPDYVVGSDISGAQQANPGQLGFFVVSGATGIAVNVISTTSYGGGLMLRAVGVGDVNGDGRGEFVVASPDSGTLTLFGGSVFFPVLATRPLDGHGASYFPAARATWEALEASTLLDVTDIDNDGVRELWVGSPMPRLPLPTGGHSVLGPGQVALYSGRTLERMGFIPGTGWNESFGSGIADLGDVNGDGRGDVLVGVPLPALRDERAARFLRSPGLRPALQHVCRQLPHAVRYTARDRPLR